MVMPVTGIYTWGFHMFSKPLMLSIGAGGAAIAAVVASANSLGGVTTSTLGAGTHLVASCDSDGVGVSYTTSFLNGDYTVATADVSGINVACAGKNIKVTLYDADGDAIEEGTGTLGAAPLTEASIALAGDTTAESVKGVAVVITG